MPCLNYNQSEIKSTSKKVPHIFRVAHKSKFTTISNKVLQDKTLSWCARGILTYMLSLPEDWVFCKEIIQRQSPDCERTFKKGFRELRDLGYVQRTTEKNELGKIVKHVWLVHEEPVSKKESTRAEIPLLDKSTLMDFDPTNKVLIPKQNPKEKEIQKHIVSADARDVCSLFFEGIKKLDPGFKEPDLEKWECVFDKIIRIDGRAPDLLKFAILWIQGNLFWRSKILSPTKLRTQLTQILIQKGDEEIKSRNQVNRNFCLSLKEQYPEEFKTLTFTSEYVLQRNTGKDIMFDMNPEAFQRAVVSLFGGDLCQ